MPIKNIACSHWYAALSNENQVRSEADVQVGESFHLSPLATGGTAEDAERSVGIDRRLHRVLACFAI